jgi:hypothetical protein
MQIDITVDNVSTGQVIYNGEPIDKGSDIIVTSAELAEDEYKRDNIIALISNGYVRLYAYGVSYTITDLEAMGEGTWVPHGNVYPEDPVVGTRFFRDDLSLSYYWDGTNWVEGGGGSTENLSIREYGETLLVIRNQTTATTPAINSNSASSAFDVWQRLDESYGYCYFDIKVYDGGVLHSEYPELRFTGRAQVAAWVDANIPRTVGAFDYTARMRCYDKIDSTVQAPNRIWGVNSVYARLRDPSTGYYHRSGRRSASPDSRWSDIEDFLADLWQKIYGVPHPDAGAFTPQSYECFWFSGRKDNFYRCGYEATRVKLPIAGYNYRSMVTPVGAVADAQSINWWYYDNAAKLTIPAINPVGDDWEFLQPGVLPDDKIFSRQAQLFMEGHAVAVAFGMTDDDGNRGVLIKPVTVDMFWLPWVDVTNFRYEYLANFDVQGTNKVRPINMNKSKYQEGNVMGPWSVGEFVYGSMSGGRFYGSGAKPGHVRIQVRNLTTGHISPLSNTRIRFRGRRRYIQLSALIESAGSR